MTPWVRRCAVWAVAVLAVLSIGVSAVPVLRRATGGTAPVRVASEGQAVEEPLAPDLAPIIGFAPFGSAAAPEEPPPVEGETSLGLVLLGVTVGDPETASRAIVGGGDVPVASYAIGDEIASTVRLAEVHPGHVVLDVDGRSETLSFAARGSSAAPPSEAAPPSDGGPDLQNMIPRREEASDATGAQPDDAAGDGAAEPDPDAILADYMAQLEDDPQAVLDRLGLIPTDEGYRIADTAAPAVRDAGFRPGDLLTRVNGQKVGDLSTDQGYFKDVAASGRARVELQRDGQTIVLTFPLR